MKTCTKCGNEKPLSEFYLRRGVPRPSCKDCVKRDNQIREVLNMEKRKEQKRVYGQTETVRAKQKVHSQNRRNAEGTLPNDAWNRLIQFFGEQCMFPGCDETTPLHLDHVVPLSKGGTNTLDNAQILCAFHNISKGARSSADYRQGRVCC